MPFSIVSPLPALRASSTVSVVCQCAVVPDPSDRTGPSGAGRESEHLPVRVDLILATGGASMVKAAHSSGNPAIGVGPGNAPAVIGPNADLKDAVSKITWSRTSDLFDWDPSHEIVQAGCRYARNCLEERAQR